MRTGPDRDSSNRQQRDQQRHGKTVHDADRGQRDGKLVESIRLQHDRVWPANSRRAARIPQNAAERANSVAQDDVPEIAVAGSFGIASRDCSKREKQARGY